MSFFDIALLIILFGFVIKGLFKGLIRMIGSLIGLIIGAYVASRYYLIFYNWADTWINVNPNLGKVLAFIILFAVVARLVEFLFSLLEKVFKFLAVIPGSRYINNLLGAILGFFGGALFLGLIIYVISRYAIIGHFFADQLAASLVAPWLLKIAGLALPLLPEALKLLQSII